MREDIHSLKAWDVTLTRVVTAISTNPILLYSHCQSSRQPIYQFNIFCCTACNDSRFHNYIKAKKKFACVNSPPLIEPTLPSIWSNCNCKQKGHTHFCPSNSNFITLKSKPMFADACHGSSNSVFVLTLPLCFMIVGVAGVQRATHLSHSCLQSGCKKLDILLHAQVQDLINPLCKVNLNIWPQSNLSKKGRDLRKGITYWQDNQD